MARVKLAVFVLSAVYASVAGSYFFVFGRLYHAGQGRLSVFGRVRGHGRHRRHGVGPRQRRRRRRSGHSAAATGLVSEHEQVMLGLDHDRLMIFLARDCSDLTPWVPRRRREDLLEVDGSRDRLRRRQCARRRLFVVDTPQMFSIIGPNGAGKTTLFNMFPASIGRTRTGSVRRRGHHRAGAASAGCPRRVAYVPKPAEFLRA